LDRDQLRQRVAFCAVADSGLCRSIQISAAIHFALAGYLDLINKDAFGNFRQLLDDVTLSPAMGRYLDMLQNDKEGRGPRARIRMKTMAREILQLFSVGLYKLHPDGSLVLDAKRVAGCDLRSERGCRALPASSPAGATAGFPKTEQNWLYPECLSQWVAIFGACRCRSGRIIIQRWRKNC